MDAALLDVVLMFCTTVTFLVAVLELPELDDLEVELLLELLISLEIP